MRGLGCSCIVLLGLAFVASACGKSGDRLAAEVARGKELYLGFGCAACHGPTAKGDGPAALALGAKPRDLTNLASFRQGNSPEAIAKTIEEGLAAPGLAMPAAPYIAKPDRLAIAHWLLSLAPAASARASRNAPGAVDPWVRESIAGRDVTAAYMTIDNRGLAADALVAARCDCAATVEIHRMVEDAGRMTMEKMPRLELPADALVVLEPGGLHLMLFALGAELRAGQRVTLELDFERAGTIVVDAEVRAPAGKRHAPPAQ